MSERRARERFGRWIDVHRRLTEEIEVPSVLRAIGAVVTDAVDADAVSVSWMDEGRFRAVIHEGEIVAETDGADGEATAAIPLRREAEIEGRLARVPLMGRSSVVGMLEVRREPRKPSFRPSELAFLEAIAAEVAFVLSYAYAFAELRRLHAENRQLYAISMDLGRALELDELLRRILDHLSAIVPYDAAGIYLKRQGSDEIEWLEHVGYPGDAKEPLVLKLGEGIVGRVAASGDPERIDDVRDDARYVEARSATRSELVVPIFESGSEGAILGAFNLESDRVAAYGRGDVERLEAFASLAAVAIEREWDRTMREEKRRIDRELAVARRIQRYFLPRRTPIVPGFDMWGAQNPSIEMSGDYYDVISISSGHFGLVIADVSGKGVPAALIMASVRAGLLSEVRNVYAIRAIISELNAFLVSSTEQGAFVTAFYGVLDTDLHALTYVNAGHDPPLLVRASGGSRWLDTGGTVLGAFPDARFEEERIALASGDVIVLYTDGITEARRGEEELFGRARVERVVAGLAGRSAREIGEALVGAVADFSGRDVPEDDETVLVVRMR